jgi:hypothetical protein
MSHDIICLRVWQNLAIVLLFLSDHLEVLAETDLKALQLLLQPEVLEVVRVRAIFAEHLLLPVMEEAAKPATSEEYRQKAEAWKALALDIAQDPDRLLSLEVSRRDGPLSGKLAAALPGLLQLVEEHLDDPDLASRSTDLISNDGNDDDEEDDDENDDENDDAQGEIPRAPLLRRALQKELPNLDRLDAVLGADRCPSTKQQARVLASDFALSFLFIQDRHKGNWREGEQEFLVATSRSVERIFAQAKLILARNKETRPLLLEAIICLQRSPCELVALWEKYQSPSTRARTTSALAQPSQAKLLDKVAFDKLQKEKEAAKAKIEDKKKKKAVSDILGIPRPKKEDLLRFLGLRSGRVEDLEDLVIQKAPLSKDKDKDTGKDKDPGAKKGEKRAREEGMEQ